MINLFVRFCNEIARGCDTLYILGDLVEYWLGDDDESTGLQPAFAAMRELADSGSRIMFMHGNRDFLVGNTLAKRCGFDIIQDPSVVEIDLTPVLLMHGDTLCTDDTGYMEFRRMVRKPEFQTDFLARPLDERHKIARTFREESMKATASKRPEIMDVNQHAVTDTMQKHRTRLLIHGHTHRPAIHDFVVGSGNYRRIVLGDWYEKGSYLRLNTLDTPELVVFN